MSSATALPVPARKPVQAVAKSKVNEIALRRTSSGSYDLIVTGSLPWIFSAIDELRSGYAGANGIPGASTPPPPRKPMSAAGRAKISEAARKRHAAQKGQEAAPPAPAKKPKTMTAAG